MSFLGYIRPDGSVGTRNHVLVIPQGLISKSISDFVVGTKTIRTVDHGSGRTAEDRERVARVLIGLGLNPNVDSVIVHAASPGAMYPELRAERLADEIAASGKRVEVVDPVKEGGVYRAIAKGCQLARMMVYEASKLRREEVGDEHLCVGVKCGYSDTTSGIAGNPAVGYLFDKIVNAGGTTFFGETTELIGAEQAIAKRAVSPEVATALLDAVAHRENLAKSTGLDIRTINPIPANIKAGLSSLEEKSLGAVYKAGTTPLQGVLQYAERPKGKGLYFVDNWMGAYSIFVGYAAAGANLVMFQLGGGGMAGRDLLEGTPSVVTPFMWCTANPKTYEMTGDNIDFYSGTVIEGKEDPEQVGERLYQTVIDIASGTLSRNETMVYNEPIDMYLEGPRF
ncbi:carbohydrate hydrolase [Desulfosarcina widdelii]|uniref:Carbohydrate hydrolase n=1 Tax=Desulfosarcina widdelii TaxID=947919 RepID=A0A5K7ZBN0_9BACT|nr:UxaA family hydrolase [Desulfosarcina widdelii]BBO78508.1 carbohydrate hydrolase [Desulfosarcina widdelii]